MNGHRGCRSLVDQLQNITVDCFVAIEEGTGGVPNFDLLVGDGYLAYLQKRSIVTSMEDLLQLMRASMSKCCYRKAWYKCVKKDS